MQLKLIFLRTLYETGNIVQKRRWSEVKTVNVFSPIYSNSCYFRVCCYLLFVVVVVYCHGKFIYLKNLYENIEVAILEFSICHSHAKCRLCHVWKGWFQKHFLSLYNALLPLFQKELSSSLLAWNTGGFPLKDFKPLSVF